MKPPRRRVKVVIEIGADDEESVIAVLDHISSQFERGGVRDIVSGGRDSGFFIRSDIDETITHDSYFEEVERYLDWSSNRKEYQDG